MITIILFTLMGENCIIERTKPSRPIALARCSMRVNDMRLPGSLLFIILQIAFFVA